MALINRWIASATYRDGVGRDSVVSIYVTESDAEEWINAMDETTRAATPIGVYFDKLDTMTAAALVSRTVTMQQVVDLPLNPADEVLRGNKLAVEFLSAGRGYVITIPARNPAAYTQKPDSLEVNLTSGVVPAFIAAFEDVAISVNGAGVDVRRIRVAD